MSDHIKIFNTIEEQTAFMNSEDYVQPHVSYVLNRKKLKYNKYSRNEYNLRIPLTINILGEGSITWALEQLTVQYSKNKGPWTTAQGNFILPVVAGDVVRFKGTNNSYSFKSLQSTAPMNIKGNLMSLIYGDNFFGQTSVPANAFYYLFSGNTLLFSSKDLKLPATTLTPHCYGHMFNGCTSMIDYPELPALVLSSNCYCGMFANCYSLTSGPKLPATTLASDCYNAMFSRCTSLVEAPTLPATTLAGSCYQQMFQGCSSLVNAPVLPAIELEPYCYSAMFTSCSSLSYIKAMFTTEPNDEYTYHWVEDVAAEGVFVKNSNANWTNVSYSGIPSSWTIQTASE